MIQSSKFAGSNYLAESAGKGRKVGSLRRRRKALLSHWRWSSRIISQCLGWAVVARVKNSVVYSFSF